MHEDTMQTERAGTNEAGNRKAKRWGFRWYPDRASQSAREQPGQPNRAGQDAGRPGRSRQPDRASQRRASVAR